MTKSNLNYVSSYHGPLNQLDLTGIYRIEIYGDFNESIDVLANYSHITNISLGITFNRPITRLPISIKKLTIMNYTYCHTLDIFLPNLEYLNISKYCIGNLNNFPKLRFVSTYNYWTTYYYDLQIAKVVDNRYYLTDITSSKNIIKYDDIVNRCDINNHNMIKRCITLFDQLIYRYKYEGSWIIFDDDFNESLDTIDFYGVTGVHFGVNFNQSISCLSWYPNITDIYFDRNSKFNQQIKPSDLPIGLKSLEFGYSFRQYITLPDGLMEVSFGSRYNSEMNIPSTLLILHYYDQQIYPHTNRSKYYDNQLVYVSDSCKHNFDFDKFRNLKQVVIFKDFFEYTYDVSISNKSFDHYYLSRFDNWSTNKKHFDILNRCDINNHNLIKRQVSLFDELLG